MVSLRSRQLVMAVLLVSVVGKAAFAGKLGQARQAVRNEPPKQEVTKKQEVAKKSKPSGGKLQTARSSARQTNKGPVSGPQSGGGRRPRRVRRSRPHCHTDWCFGPSVFYSSPPCYTTYTYVQPTVVPAPDVVIAAPPEPSTPITPELRTCFSHFPYANGAGGFLDLQPAGCGKVFSGSVDFEFGSDFDGLTRQGAGVMLEHISGLGIDFHWDSFRESLAGDEYDELHVGDLNAMYRVVQTDHTLVRVGLGVNWLGDAYSTDAGLNLTMKADFAPVQPLVFSTELDFGTVGDAEMLHGAATVGLTLDRLEIYGGYDYRRIGQAELQGPMLGLRIWF